MVSAISPDLKSRLRAVLERHVGRGQAVTAGELAEMLGMKGSDADRHVREVILQLIWEGLPVLAATEKPAGFFIVETWQDWEEYQDTTRSRIAETCKRLAQDKKNVHAHFEGVSKVRML